MTTPPIGEGPLWRRTRLTGELPLPERDPGGWRGGLGLLRELSALAEPSWRMAVAWLLAGLRPDMPRPVAYFNGERGTAKTTSARQLLRVLDGIRAEVRNVPRSEDDGAVAASVGWTMGLDNIHGIPQWLSDFLCRTVTGASVAKREMYTDDDVTSWALPAPRRTDRHRRRRPPARPRPNDCSPSPWRPSTPRPGAASTTCGAATGPRTTASSAACSTWRPPCGHAYPTRPPSSANGHGWPTGPNWLWALDAVTGWDTLATYTGAQEEITDDVLDADPVATALTRWASTADTTEWQATTGQIDTVLRPPGPLPDTWPKTTALLSARLTSLAPVLRQRGIDIRKLPRTGSARGFLITLNPAPDPRT